MKIKKRTAFYWSIGLILLILFYMIDVEGIFGQNLQSATEVIVRVPHGVPVEVVWNVGPANKHTITYDAPVPLSKVVLVTISIHPYSKPQVGRVTSRPTDYPNIRASIAWDSTISVTTGYGYSTLLILWLMWKRSSGVKSCRSEDGYLGRVNELEG